MGALVGLVALLVVLGVGAGVVWYYRGELEEARGQRDVAESVARELTGRARYLEEQLRIAAHTERAVAEARDGRADRRTLDALYADLGAVGGPGRGGGRGDDGLLADDDGAPGSDAAAGEAGPAPA